MTYLKTTAAALALAATPLVAQMTTTGEMGANSGLLADEMSTGLIRAENVIGAEIFAMDAYDEGLWETNSYYETTDPEWEEVGNVTDIVFSRDGQMVGVVASMGGWLDIGDTDILLSFDDLRVVGQPMDDGWGNLNLVTRLSEEQIEEIEESDSSWF